MSCDAAITPIDDTTKHIIEIKNTSTDDTPIIPTKTTDANSSDLVNQLDMGCSESTSLHTTIDNPSKKKKSKKKKATVDVSKEDTNANLQEKVITLPLNFSSNDTSTSIESTSLSETQSVIHSVSIKSPNPQPTENATTSCNQDVKSKLNGKKIILQQNSNPVVAATKSNSKSSLSIKSNTNTTTTRTTKSAINRINDISKANSAPRASQVKGGNSGASNTTKGTKVQALGQGPILHSYRDMSVSEELRHVRKFGKAVNLTRALVVQRVPVHDASKAPTGGNGDSGEMDMAAAIGATIPMGTKHHVSGKEGLANRTVSPKDSLSSATTAVVVKTISLKHRDPKWADIYGMPPPGLVGLGGEMQCASSQGILGIQGAGSKNNSNSYSYSDNNIISGDIGCSSSGGAPLHCSPFSFGFTI